MIDFQSLLINRSSTIKQTMRLINENEMGLALIVDDVDRFVGLVTDGDIRRALINDYALDEPIESIANKDPLIASENLPPEQIANLLNEKIRFIPVIDLDDRVKGVVSFADKKTFYNVRSLRICILGMGYVGLTLAASMADVGFQVAGFDTNGKIRKRLMQKQSHFYEKGLDMMLYKHIGKNFRILDDIGHRSFDMYIITVGTPIDRKSMKLQLDYVKNTAEIIAKKIKKNNLVIMRSTVSVGTTRNVVLPILEKASGLRAKNGDLFLAVAPERTIEGKALKEVRNLPQIVGGLNDRSTELASRIFNEVTRTIVDVGSLESAEMCKLIDNTYRDVMFAYANQMGLICEKLGLDMVELVKAVNLGYDRNQVPTCSPGVGGACLTKDPYILIDLSKKVQQRAKLSEVGREINEYMPTHLVDKVVNKLVNNGKEVKGSKIFIIGFAFKGEPETADTRDSPTIPVVKRFLEMKGQVYGYDPVVEHSAIKDMGAIPCDLEEGFDNADVVIIMNNHKSYEDINVLLLLNRTNKPAVFIDGWHIFEPEDIKRLPGIVYGGIGNE